LELIYKRQHQKRTEDEESFYTQQFWVYFFALLAASFFHIVANGGPALLQVLSDLKGNLVLIFFIIQAYIKV